MNAQKVVIGRILKRSVDADLYCFKICSSLDDLQVVKKMVTKTLSKSGFAVEIEGE